MRMKKIFIFMIFAFLFSFDAALYASADENFHAKAKSENHMNIFLPDKSSDEVLQSMIREKIQKFQLLTYKDAETGLEIKYNLYLPENYSSDKNEKKYPAVFFIADASSVGKEPEFSLTQGYGGLVWTEYDCIVIVPVYAKIVIDDHVDFILSDYVEPTKRLVKYVIEKYRIDESRIYATGQSMGCMTFLTLAAKYPKLFTACLFVSGQWDINALEGLKTQKFIYITSAGDDKASAGQHEVIEMFNKNKIPYVSYQNIEAKNPRIYLSNKNPVNFITFTKGSTLPDETTESYSEHMTSFDYAYKIKALREWLLAQKK